MVEAGSVMSITFIFRLFDAILKKLKKDAMREDLARSLEIPVKNVEESLENLNFSLYRFIGAGILGNIFEPPTPKETAQKIVDDIDIHYSKFIHDFKELSKYFDAHMDDFREILSQKEILALEACVKAFENDTPDYNFLMNHGIFKSQISKEVRKKKTFVDDLNKKFSRKMKTSKNLSAVSNSINSEQIQLQQLFLETMTRILFEKRFSIERDLISG